MAIGNIADFGGGAYYSSLNNCTVKFNYALTPGSGGGVYKGFVRNSIIIGNADYFAFLSDNYAPAAPLQVFFYFSCTSPNPSGNGNISADPQFLDLFHIATTSLCYGTGTAAYSNGFDLDDEPWNNPPSMGCDEVVLSNLVGSLSAQIIASSTNLLVNRPAGFTGIISGRAAWAAWDYGDGVVVTNSGWSGAHVWTNPGDYPVTFTVYNLDNSAGVSATTVVHVQPLNTPQLQSIGMVGGTFQFEFTGQSGANYTIQYTTDLSSPGSWQTLQTIFMSGGGVIPISDPNATDAARYYRVLAQ